MGLKASIIFSPSIAHAKQLDRGFCFQRLPIDIIEDVEIWCDKNNSFENRFEFCIENVGKSFSSRPFMTIRL